MREYDRRRDRLNRVAGLIENQRNDLTPAGYYVAVNPNPDSGRPLASGFSHADGGFLIRLGEQEHAALQEVGEVRIVVDDRFGRRVVEAGPFGIEEAADGVLISIDVPADEDRPEPVRFWNPFSQLRRVYHDEIAALGRADISDWDTFEQLDVDAVADRIGVDVERLRAFRLHAEMNTSSPIFDVGAAFTLTRIGIRTRRDLASLEPHELLSLISDAASAGKIALEGFERAFVGNWVFLARGWDLFKIYEFQDPERIKRTERLIWSVLLPHNPGLDAVKFIEPSYWATLHTIARMRAILTSAGVHDLTALAPFSVRGHRRIDPGYHFQPGLRHTSLLDDLILRNRLIIQGGGFSKVIAVEATDYGLHIKPNPVTQAVILGPLIDFLDGNARLVVGRDVTELIIVTDTVDCNIVNKIVYEDELWTPPQPPGFPARPDLPRYPANATSVYTPGSENRKGRDGARGTDGMPAGDGFPNVEDAPSLKLYVKSSPNGLPDILLVGRPGGVGGDGQAGGPGEDGAKGRESVGTFWTFCVTNVGHGGKGGDGGNGGPGGKGGMGSRGGSLEIYSPRDNLDTLLRREEFAIGLTGGERGPGGSGGAAGPKGRGGESGHDTAGCDPHSEWHGADGADGAAGSDGGRGDVGENGHFFHVPISLSQWNAAFTYPYLLRLEPTSGPPGTFVTAVGVNVSKYATLLFGRNSAMEEVAATFNATKNTVTFTVPDSAVGGPNKVILATNTTGTSVPGLSDTMSNALLFRVTPVITSLDATAGVPGQRITVTGKGFAAGSPPAQILFGSKVLKAAAGFISDTRLTFDLPYREDIGLPAGPVAVLVQNPDGGTSNAITFTLSLTYSIRMRAFRVYPEAVVEGGGGFGSGGTNRKVSEIQDILVNDENSPTKVWAQHGIALTLGAIEDIQLPEPWGDGSVPYGVNPADVTTVDPGAISFYFINDIDDATTHAYTQGKVTPGPGFVGLGPRVTFEDTGSLTTSRAAVVAAHEVGHALGLTHVCSKSAEDENPDTTLFGRVCDTSQGDNEYLMFPRVNFISHTGTAVTAQEAVLVRRSAARLHGR